MGENIKVKKSKKLSGVKKFFGVLKDDREFDLVLQDLKKGWAG